MGHLHNKKLLILSGAVLHNYICLLFWGVLVGGIGWFWAVLPGGGWLRLIWVFLAGFNWFWLVAYFVTNLYRIKMMIKWCHKNRHLISLNRAYSSCFMRATIEAPFFKIFSHFVRFCPNFQIFCPFLPFFVLFLKNRTHIPIF